MGKLTAILVPLALMHAASGKELYQGDVLDTVGTDFINDVFRVFAEYALKAPPPRIPKLERTFPFSGEPGNTISVNALNGTMSGVLTIENTKKAKISVDPLTNVIQGTFPITFKNLKFIFDVFQVQFAHFQDEGKVITRPKTNVIQLQMSVKHKPVSGIEKCTVTLEKATTIELTDFETTVSGFGDPTINKDIDRIIEGLFSKEVLGTYIDKALKQYAAQIAPKVFRYCKYVPDIKD